MEQRVQRKYLEHILTILVAVILILPSIGPAQAASTTPNINIKPTFSTAVAFDVSMALSDMAPAAQILSMPGNPDQEPVEIRPERGPDVQDQGYSGDGALQAASGQAGRMNTTAIPAPLANFEGLSNTDNFNIFGFRVNPPDPMGDVGPNHYVEMITLVFGVYDKAGNLLLGPVAIGSLWEGLASESRTAPPRDPHLAAVP